MSLPETTPTSTGEAVYFSVIGIPIEFIDNKGGRSWSRPGIGYELSCPLAPECPVVDNKKGVQRDTPPEPCPGVNFLKTEYPNMFARTETVYCQRKESMRADSIGILRGRT